MPSVDHAVAPAEERLGAVLRAGLFAVLLLSPLPFGSVQPWAVLAIQLCAATLAALTLAMDPASLPSRARLMLIPCGVILAVPLLQFLPAPASWTSLVAAPTAAVREQVAAVLPAAGNGLAPQSLEPPATLDAMLRLLSYVLIGIVTAMALRNRTHLLQAAVVLAVAGSFQALYGSAEYLSGHQHIFGYAKTVYHDEASGTFINRNHFASYLAMTLPFALALVARGAARLPRTESWRQRFVHLWEPAGLSIAFGGLAAALIWTGLILSYSRAGLGVALVATAFFAFLASRRHGRLRLFAAVLVVPTVLLLWQEVRLPGERFLSGEGDLATMGSRLTVWRATINMVPDFLPLGSGLGTFEGLFSLYRPPGIRKLWDHAHNDWVQSLAEGGLITLVAIVALLVLTLKPARGERFTEGSSTVRLAAAAGVVAVACHSVFDFSLRIPAVAVLLAVLVGITCVRTSPDGSSTAVFPGNRQRRI